IRTMKQSFPTVQLLAAGPAWESGGANVWVIAGSQDGLDVDRLRTQLGADGSDVRCTVMPPELLDQYIEQGPQIVLTDEYAPVDNLIAILFRSRGEPSDGPRPWEPQNGPMGRRPILGQRHLPGRSGALPGRRCFVLLALRGVLGRADDALGGLADVAGGVLDP